MSEPEQERCFADELHERVLAVIAELMKLDPPLDSPEGRLLHHLAGAADRFEQERYPELDRGKPA